MESTLHRWKTSRAIHAVVFDTYNLEQLHKFSADFNSNLFSNIGRVIAAQQWLVYRSGNLAIYIRDDFFNRYKPSSKPTATVTQQEANEMKMLLTSLIQKNENDLVNNLNQ